MRGEKLPRALSSVLLPIDFSLILHRFRPCLLISLLSGTALLTSAAGFGQEKPADGVDQRKGANQLWAPQLNKTEQCTKCHQEAAKSGLEQSSVSQPYVPDPLVPHHNKEWGCTVCHRGQGAAMDKEGAHQPKVATEQPLLPITYIQASCGICHRTDLPDTPNLNHGRQLLSEYGCVACHRVESIERPTMPGPDLTNIGAKVSPEWIYKWLKEPRTITDSSGNTVVSGYQTHSRMPQFQLDDKELRSLCAFLSSLHTAPAEPYKFDPQILATLESSPDVVEQGEARFREMFCTTCHSVAVVRAGETKLIGGEIGPELTKVGSKVNANWLVAWLRSPQAYLPQSQMPRYEWSDRDLYVVTRYIRTKLVDPDVLSDVPKISVPSPEEIRFGRRVFLKKGCASCHAVEGMKPQEDFGPDLSHIGSEYVSHLQFGKSGISRNLATYIRAKISAPASVNPSAEMPQFALESADLDDLTTALLGMTGPPSSSEMERLIVARAKPEFHPGGAFEPVYERYKCYVCHQFNGYGGKLAPDLSYEGSRAQRQWMIYFLKNPQTLRPTLILRMPQFNMTDQEASILADYMAASLQSPSVHPGSVDVTQFTSQIAAQGKTLYEVKYQCQSCHTIGTTGGYVGPDLSNVGNWMTPAWVAAWLKDPQALVPGSIEPQRSMAEDEVKALTAYLMTLRQSGTAPHAGAAAGDAP